MNWKDETLFDILRVLVMWIAAVLRNLIGPYDNFLLTLILFISADYITGVVAAIVTKRVSSHTGTVGLLKKFGILCVVSLTTIMETNILESTTLRSAVILYYISNEGISILENLCRIGVPIPQKLRSVLISLSDNKNNKE